MQILCPLYAYTYFPLHRPYCASEETGSLPWGACLILVFKAHLPSLRCHCLWDLDSLIEDPILFSRSCFPSRETFWRTIFLFKTSIASRGSNSLLEVPAPSRSRFSPTTCLWLRSPFYPRGASCPFLFRLSQSWGLDSFLKMLFSPMAWSLLRTIFLFEVMIPYSRSFLRSWFLLKPSITPRFFVSLLETGVGRVRSPPFLSKYFQSPAQTHIPWQDAKDLPPRRFGTWAKAFSGCSWDNRLVCSNDRLHFANRNHSCLLHSRMWFPPSRWFKVSPYQSLELVDDYNSLRKQSTSNLLASLATPQAGLTISLVK